MRVWHVHDKAVTTLAFAPGGGTLATAGEGDPAVRVWDVATASEVRTFSLFSETPASLAFAPDGRILAAGWPWSIQLWDVATGDKRLILEGCRHFSASLAFSVDGQTLLSAGRRLGGVTADVVQSIVWDLTDGRVQAEFVGPVAVRLSAPIALDAETILWMRPHFGDKEAAAVITDVATGKPRAVLATDAPVHAAALSSDGRTLATAVRGDVLLWTLPDLDEAPDDPAPRRGLLDLFRRHARRPALPPLISTVTLQGAAERLDAVAFTGDGCQVIAGGAAGTVRAWLVPEEMPSNNDEPPESRPSTAAFQWNAGPITALAVAPDGLTAVSGTTTGRVVVWDLEV